MVDAIRWWFHLHLIIIKTLWSWSAHVQNTVLHTEECQFQIISSRHLDSQSLSSPRRSMKSSSNVTRNIKVIWSICVSQSKTIHISRHLVLQLAGKQILKLSKSHRFPLCSYMIHDWRDDDNVSRLRDGIDIRSDIVVELLLAQKAPCDTVSTKTKRKRRAGRRESEREKERRRIYGEQDVKKKSLYKVIERKGVPLKVESITCWNMTIPWRVKSKRSNYEMIWCSKTFRVIWHFLRNTQETLSLTANILMDRL